jgi:hypothetical protein
LQCLKSADCAGGIACVDGRCLNACESAESASCGANTESCMFGFCMPVAGCFLAEDCPAAKQCINGQCGALE